MRRPIRIARIAALALALVFPIAGMIYPPPGGAQETREKGFYDVEELRRLLEVARESGFSERELREITIEDRGKVINVWEYLAEIERQKKLAAERLKAQRAKIYLTVQDLLKDMRKKEPEDLSKLRDKIPTE